MLEKSFFWTAWRGTRGTKANPIEGGMTIAQHVAIGDHACSYTTFRGALFTLRVADRSSPCFRLVNATLEDQRGRLLPLAINRADHGWSVRSEIMAAGRRLVFRWRVAGCGVIA